jgi:hypothetical protein
MDTDLIILIFGPRVSLLQFECLNKGGTVLTAKHFHISLVATYGQNFIKICDANCACGVVSIVQ